MKYIELKDDSVKYHINKDTLYIRIGIWDYTEITLDRKSFVDHNSSFDDFVRLFCSLLDGQVIKESELIDPYWKSLIDELIENNLIIGYQEKTDSLIYVITDLPNCKKISKYNKLCNQNMEIHSIDEPVQIYDTYRYLVVVGNPDKNVLEKINNIFFQKNKSWSMGIIDGKFMHLTTFVPHITGCFECFALDNSLRMADYENYVEYLREEDNLNKANQSNGSVLLAYQLLLTFTSQHINSLRGQLLSIYLPRLEFNLEPLRKSSLCTLDGLRAQEISENLNIDAQTVIHKLLEDQKNDK
ncbi:hypothetical protein CBF56_06180 [Lactobacillus taiwanensis]|uniref:hypothetical protein n=1 Tax=Lactobacillus taiwanensis TaxID=508451 RepID=UPI000B993A02|nr:hypothetical protein [Lactobacillus taiwanensis]OYS15875.1 hypothetical protein CBF49_09545 [Lactobacillus taiwanensis]OYS17559.1 hypothetical protein CBF56_06180 [Lactobacillus taiwanensis]